ncbi:hypothetical protein TpMuguga_01g00375 [Theileria parva strain Muguga]|uniref:Uncharacterized protein n=1 Tax=Theileria parva TaxID=5875 RepID=Q4N8T9_THEPA|nr:uncharacterized protein TpMuguga_01g00375 [Theileria parva strain Muguga]EAN33619.1 hypothetical protein TpMuguga_01g00375 [Theileria parva strain Muguga]|eukprot:XP_765902.1 hypothetical protein [Theileria parva strain Muguga]
MSILPILLFLFAQAISGMKPAGNTCRLPALNNTMNRCVQTLKDLSNGLLSIPNNTVHKFHVKKSFDGGKNVVSVHLGKSDDLVKPMMYSNENSLDPNVKPKFQKNYLNLDELSVNYTHKLDQDLSYTGNVVIDLPRTAQIFLKGVGGAEVKTVNVDTRDVLKRLDFILRYRNTLVGGSYNFRSKEKSVELIQRLENLYRLYGKNMNVTPKLELMFDKNNKLSTRACLVMKRDNLTITPIIYPNQKKCELAAEAKLTDEVKFGVFVSKDKNLYLNLSYESNWGKHSWQQFSLRFVLSDVLKSYAYLQNELQL